MAGVFKRSHMCGLIDMKNVGENVILNGWVAKQRRLGGLVFVDLRDKTGIVQVTFDENTPKSVFEARLRRSRSIGYSNRLRTRRS